MGSGASSDQANIYKRYLYSSAARRAQEILREEWLVRIMRDGCSLEDAPADLRGDRNFVLEAVHRTRASWLGKLASKSLQVDKDFLSECSRLAGSGLIFTYYSSPTCFPNMRLRFQISGASIPGGQAYDQVSRNMKRESGDKGISTVWFGEKLVWGHTADLGDWVHPNHDCGRDQVPLPNFSEQDAKWRSMVESRSETCYPEVGRSYICWCCHWLRLVRERQQEGKVMCCTVSNIFKPEWVALYGAGSSEVSDATADELGLPRESFRNGKPDGWGESEILIAGHAYERKAPIHPRTGLPLGSACRWERSMLDSFEFPVYAFFKP